MMLPQLTPYIKGRQQIVTFKGYSDAPVIDDGEMRDMLNLSSDKYPILTQRPPRGLIKGLDNVKSILSSKEKLAYIRGDVFYYDGKEIFTLRPAGKERTLVTINQKLCIFPDKLYYDLNTGMLGHLNAEFISDDGTIITITENTVTFETENHNTPANLDLFKVGDTVVLTGFVTNPANNVSAKIVGIDDDTFVFGENTFTTEGYPTDLIEEGRVTMSRNVPDLDYVIEIDNRLWGTSKNTIYSCSLADPTNWNDYSAISNASYAVTVGTDGEFTGISNATTHICFFKENYIHRLYGNKPSTYQINTIEGLGVESGSSKSIQRINSSILYKSREGIVAYDGSYPTLITQKFRYKYKNAVAGTNLMKYYVSMVKDDGTSDMLVYDLNRGIWHIEDHTRATSFTYHKGTLLYVSDGKIYETIAKTGEAENMDDIEWFAEFGAFNEYDLYYNQSSISVDNKHIYNKLKMRIDMFDRSHLKVLIKVDNGEWEQLYEFKQEHKRTLYIPIKPRRCDKFSIRLEGKGKVEVSTLTREVRGGSAHD